MPRIMITFLGRTSKGEYTDAIYDFGAERISVPIFGIALSKIISPDRVVFLGTSKSMWDYLISTIDDSNGIQDLRLKLLEQEEEGNVTQQTLDQIEPIATKSLGRPCTLRLIPAGRESKEQVEILERIAEQVSRGDEIFIDVTHGLRHLPMLALVSALYLETVSGGSVRGIYYGAFDMKEGGVTPVIRLDGLLSVTRWIRAISSYDKDGDYGVFAPLLEEENIPHGSALSKASFFERCSNPVKAKAELTRFRVETLRQSPVASLFVESLQKRISWSRHNERSEWERNLATAYLGRSDYLRAAIYGLESLVTSELEREKKDLSDFSHRQETLTRLGKEDDNVKLFQFVRNALAHGVRGEGKRIKDLCNDEKRMRSFIEKMLDPSRDKGRVAED